MLKAAALVTACAADAVPALAAALTSVDASPVVLAAPPQCCYWPLLGLWAAAHLLSLFLLLALTPTTATCSGNGRKPGEKDQWTANLDHKPPKEGLLSGTQK